MDDIAQSCRKFEINAWNTRIIANCREEELETLVAAAAQGADALLDVAIVYCGGCGYILNEVLHTAVRTAIMGGHIECVKVLRAHSVKQFDSTDTNMCLWAAAGGQLEMLKWMREQNPQWAWDTDTCFAAAYGGHLEVLKWLRANIRRFWSGPGRTGDPSYITVETPWMK